MSFFFGLLSPLQVEQILRVDMSKAQRTAYRCIVTHNLSALRRETRSTSINVMMELKKCSNHLHLVSLPEDDISEKQTSDRLQVCNEEMKCCCLLCPILYLLNKV